MSKIKKESQKFIPSNILEGMISIKAVLEGRSIGVNNRKIEKILFDQEKCKSKSRELAFLKRMAGMHGFVIEYTDNTDIDALTVGSTHGGIVAICSDRLIDEFTSDKIKDNGFYVMLDGIEDPYNYGYALRSLYAAGVTAVIMPPRNWMSAAGVVCRASAGASELFEMYTADLFDAASWLKEKGYTIAAADKSDRSTPLFDASLQVPLLLIVGGEKRGITKPLLDISDVIVELPYGRRFPAALSAASAASILAYEIFRNNYERT